MSLPCICANCGEHLTSPYFFQGKAYGWTCIKIVNPTTKQKKNKEHWVIADSHNLDFSRGKQQAIALVDGKKYQFWAFQNREQGGLTTLDNNCVRIEGETLYINLLAFKTK